MDNCEGNWTAEVVVCLARVRSTTPSITSLGHPRLAIIIDLFERLLNEEGCFDPVVYPLLEYLISIYYIYDVFFCNENHASPS